MCGIVIISSLVTMSNASNSVRICYLEKKIDRLDKSIERLVDLVEGLKVTNSRIEKNNEILRIEVKELKTDNKRIHAKLLVMNGRIAARQASSMVNAGGTKRVSSNIRDKTNAHRNKWDNLCHGRHMTIGNVENIKKRFGASYEKSKSGGSPDSINRAGVTNGEKLAIHRSTSAALSALHPNSKKSNKFNVGKKMKKLR